MSEKRWAWPETPAAQQNLETLSALARAIGMAAPGRFVLLLAKCNLPAQRQALAEHLRAMLEPLGIGLVEMGLDGSVDDLLSHLKAHLEPAGRDSGPVEERSPEPVAGWLSVQPQPAVAVAEPRTPYTRHSPFALREPPLRELTVSPAKPSARHACGRRSVADSPPPLRSAERSCPCSRRVNAARRSVPRRTDRRIATTTPPTHTLGSSRSSPPPRGPPETTSDRKTTMD